MNVQKNQGKFIEAIQESLDDGSLIKISLGNYKGADETLKKIHIKRILIKREDMLSFTYSHRTRDIVKNYSLHEGVLLIKKALGEGFHAATLFTVEFDLAFDNSRNQGNLKKSPPSNKREISLDHDRNKKRLIAADGKTYLHDLKITDQSGNVYKNAQDKFRQINKYIEILSSLVKTMPVQKNIKVVDMGAGKGYLTFALYDYLEHILKAEPEVIGVEYREDMVELCNKIAKNSNFDRLQFVQGSIENYDDLDINILIALHACDTATDDAIYKGIKAEADLIVVAPCCHKQIRREMEKGKAGNELEFLTRHGIFMERQAEMVTDGIRALILEYFGYSTKIFEFISGEHTAKNVMVVATRNPKAKLRNAETLHKIVQVKSYFGIERHYLEKIVGL